MTEKELKILKKLERLETLLYNSLAMHAEILGCITAKEVFKTDLLAEIGMTKSEWNKIMEKKKNDPFKKNNA